MSDLSNAIKPWENEIWTPEPLFLGRTVFCLASGPSLTQEAVDRLYGREVIAVNSSCRLAPWATVLFFTDNGWYAERKDLVRSWPGLVITFSRQAKRELDDPSVNPAYRIAPRVRRIKACGAPEAQPRRPGRPHGHPEPGFPPIGSPEVWGGRSSGHTAVSLAIAMGARRVVLLGYDMQPVGGREHFHDEYKGQRDLGVYGHFVSCFSGWREAAEASRVEIINCTHGSAVQEFRFAELDEVLNG